MIPGHNKSASSKDDSITPSEMKLNISWYLASQALLLSALFLAILIYFPSKPKVISYVSFTTLIISRNTYVHIFRNEINLIFLT